MSYDRGSYRPMGFGGFSFFPPVIKNLLIINGIVFFIKIIAENIVVGQTLLETYITGYFGLIPFGHPYFSFMPWQLITYQFLHANFSHIFFNMLMLWMFGMEIENIMGSRKFLVFYLLAGIGGGLLQLLLGGGGGPIIGASGAVFGVMVAFAMFFPNRMIYIYFLLPVKAKYLIVFLMVIEFMSVGDGSFVAHLAHLGGAIVGFSFVYLDRQQNFNFDKMFDIFKSNKTYSDTTFKKRSGFGFGRKEVEDAEFYEIKSDKSSEDKVDQEVIDAILDKISRSGYQNLTEKEKKILFEASKKN
ncbi:MAG: rhomboid family intramembrane serine protease [Ignavibacteriales bacterium]|nr:rhomboid family intramembrane serine protease [Ignavibacteriales bacterium]MCB9209085.1 rhomboid family intramembrane serine protease [Ignavibacteriales bacterium]MCB9217994.1 rhomboid family intramembrane serine protease [Ignavibacteriales bacterium]MCB9260383.1 rhomboid family intramembrane serine protease [Ignavibacteriales bacterium]